MNDIEEYAEESLNNLTDHNDADDKSVDNTDEIREILESNRKTQSKKPPLLVIFGVVVILLCGWLAFKWFFDWRFIVSTDDAYIENDISSISPKVGGYITDMIVHDNTKVHKGDILFVIDKTDYKIALDHADVQVEAQNRALATIESQQKAAQAQLETAQAQLGSSQALLENTQAQKNRLQKLFDGKYITSAQIEKQDTALKQAKFAYLANRAQVQAAKANIEVLNGKAAELRAQLKAARISQDKAQRDLDATIIKAPFNGVIANISAKQGEMVSPGQRLASLVPNRGFYITANYKETQLRDIRIGSVASIKVDAFGSKTFLGRVVSIAPATGSKFSLIPAQNATGNFTKVVQRVPVRIAIAPQPSSVAALRAGMSVEVEIDKRSAPDDTSLDLASDPEGNNKYSINNPDSDK